MFVQKKKETPACGRGFFLHERGRFARTPAGYSNQCYRDTRLALPWNTFWAGLVWIIQIVSPWGGST